MDYEAVAKKVREIVFDMLDRSKGQGVIHASDLDTVIEGILRKETPAPAHPWNYRVQLDGYPIDVQAGCFLLGNGEAIPFAALLDPGFKDPV